jgi:hypothetical protein
MTQSLDQKWKYAFPSGEGTHRTGRKKSTHLLKQVEQVI